MGRIIKIYGLAGSGKTQYLAEKIVDQNAIHRTTFDRMLSISFTKAAGQSLKERCARICDEKYNAIRRKSFTQANIRTLHSFAHEYFVKDYFSRKGEDGNRSMSRMYYSLDNFTPAGRTESLMKGLSKMRLYSYNNELFDQVVREIKYDDGILGVEETYNDYLKAKGDKFDYADTLVFAYNSAPLKWKFDFVSIDEAQDLSPLHWEIVKKHILSRSEITYIAGDPTQAIHIWAGADPKYFLDEEKIKSDEIIPLKESYRIPSLLLPTINALQREMKDGTDHFQITSTKRGGSFQNMIWQSAVLFLQEQSDERKDVLVLSLSGKKLRKVGDKLIASGVLFMQDKDSQFTPWTPTVTKSDWYAYTLYYHIFNKNYDEQIDHSRVFKMLDSAPRLSEVWSMFTDPAERKNTGFTISVSDLMKYLSIPEGLSSIQLIQRLFEWPPKGRRMIKAGAPKELDDQHLLRAHYRILRYIESCAQGPYVEPIIKLSTVHGAKGLEAESVVLLLTRDELRGNDEQRKLCINALCRAKERIVLTCLPEDRDYIGDHILLDVNLHGIMQGNEFSDYLESKWIEAAQS